MKILLITDHHKKAGGAENYFFTLKSFLKKIPDHTVFSIGFDDVEKEGYDYKTFKSTSSFFSKWFFQIFIEPILFFKLKKAIKKFNPDIIHIHNIKQYTSTLYHVLKRYPLVQTIHDFSYCCPTAQNIHKNGTVCQSGFSLKCLFAHHVKHSFFIYLLTIPSFLFTKFRFRKIIHHAIAPSPLLQKYLDQQQFKNTSVIPPFLEKKCSYSFHEQESAHFLYAGHLGNHKGTTFLLHAYVLAVKQYPNLKLTIAGIGKELSYLKSLAKQLAISHAVDFIGWQNDLTPYYKKATALIFPSLGLEAFGLVMIEAMSFARAVIGINRGTTAWLVDDQKTGLLFKANDKEDLADKILQLSTHLAYAQELGKNGFHKINQFINNEQSLARILAIYQESILSHTASQQ